MAATPQAAGHPDTTPSTAVSGSCHSPDTCHDQRAGVQLSLKDSGLSEGDGTSQVSPEGVR